MAVPERARVEGRAALDLPALVARVVEGHARVLIVAGRNVHARVNGERHDESIERVRDGGSEARAALKRQPRVDALLAGLEGAGAARRIKVGGRSERVVSNSRAVLRPRAPGQIG